MLHKAWNFYGPFTPMIYNTWTIALTEFAKMGTEYISWTIQLKEWQVGMHPLLSDKFMQQFMPNKSQVWMNPYA